MSKLFQQRMGIVLALVLVGAMILVGLVPAVCSAEKLPKLNLKAAQSMMPRDSTTHKEMVEMCENISKRTGGNITWKFYGPEIGDWTELQRMCMKGMIDLQFNAFDSGLDARWNILYLPFIASSWDEARKVYSEGGPFDEIGTQWAADGQLHYLGTWLNALGSITLNHDPVTNAEQAKGVKIRCPPLEIFKCYVEKMGFDTVTLPYAEVGVGLTTGVVDGAVGVGAVNIYKDFRDLARTMIVTYELCESWAITANLKMWNSLPEAYKKIFREEANKTRAKHLTIIEKEEMEYQQKLRDKGWTIVNMKKDHPQELKVWVDNCRQCWDILEPTVGKKWMDLFKKRLREMGVM
jgi:TRAP-type C4-dicarboxylate transport system substrate-binding protein